MMNSATVSSILNLLVVFGLSIASGSLLAATNYPINLEDVTDAYQELAENANSESVLKAFGLPALELNGQGFVSIGSPYEHELTSSQKFVPLFNKYNLTLALFSELSKISVPAFDGFFLDRQNKAVANFSMKNITEVIDANHIFTVIKGAQAKISKFSAIENWASLCLGSRLNADGSLTSQTLRNNVQMANFESRFDVLGEMIKILQIGSSRPNFILLDLNSTKYSEAKLKAMITEAIGILALENPKLQNTIFIATEHSYFVISQNYQLAEEKITPCQNLLPEPK